MSTVFDNYSFSWNLQNDEHFSPSLHVSLKLEQFFLLKNLTRRGKMQNFSVDKRLKVNTNSKMCFFSLQIYKLPELFFRNSCCKRCSKDLKDCPFLPRETAEKNRSCMHCFVKSCRWKIT